MDPAEEQKARQIIDADMGEIRRAAGELETFVASLCWALSSEEFRMRLLEPRIKEIPRILQKLAHKSRLAANLYSDVGDVIGLRVVVYNLSDIDRFRKGFAANRRKPLKNIKYEKVNRRSGYRALHINGLTTGPKAISCEIQVRTVLQDAWGVTTRTDFYALMTKSIRSWTI